MAISPRKVLEILHSLTSVRTCAITTTKSETWAAGSRERLLRFHDSGFAFGKFYCIDHLARVMCEMQRFAAVDVPFLTRDEFPQRRAEEYNGGRNIFDASHWSEHIAVELQPLLGVDRVMVHAFGLDGTGSDAIEANAEFRPLESERLHHRENAAACRSRMHETTQARADTSGHEYNRSAVLQHEVIRGGFRHLPGADQVVANHGLEAFVAKLARRCHELAPRVVDEDVEPAELVLDPQHGVLDLVGQANIGRYGDSVAADLAYDFSAVLDRLGSPAKHDDVCSATRHFDGRGGAHPRS